VSFRRNRGRLDGSGQKDSEGWGIENEIERERERRKKESASRHIATEDEKGDSRGRKTLGNSEEWDGGVGGMGDGGDERNTAPR